MSLDDYQAPKTFATEHAPRERAAQDTAAQHRARLTTDERRTTDGRLALRISPRIIIAGGMLLLLAALALAWPSRPLPTQSAPEPTPAPALAAPTPAPVSTPTIAPIASPAPIQPATAHVDSVPLTGRGLTIEEAAPTPVAPPPTAAPPTATPVPYNPDKPTLAAAIAYPTISTEQAAIINDQTHFTPRDSVPCGPHATRRECLLHDDYTPPTPEVH